ncbi:hypothetical protein SAMN05421676_107172 [Salinibacillus kushneri]|uniref:Uncharacterized protein n=1 Tax=Salinibacillus kushneri TaxID=237682 RepID=A0A1I0GUQ8_9BACI|nr:hypothetical protein SAMN05421676_107172 [Salinibacillus kushneri]
MNHILKNPVAAVAKSANKNSKLVKRVPSILLFIPLNKK